MTKTVFDTRQCAHVWAQQTQEVGRNSSGNVCFEGRTFYSYETPIATIVNASPKGTRVALISREGYSRTTRSKHLPAVHRAVRDLIPLFTVPFVYPFARGRYQLPLGAHGPVAQTWREIHKANLKYLCAGYGWQVDSYMRSKVLESTAGGAVRGSLTRLANTAQDYARFFKLKPPTFPIEADAARIIARRVRIESDPKRAAKAAARQAARERAEAARTQRLAVANAERITRFRAGDNVGNVSDADGCAMLRLSADGTEVETSWGASAPIPHVRSALAWYRCVKHPWSAAPLDDVPLGNFTLDRIDADGSVHAGCHRITAAEVQRLRTLLGE